MESVGFKEWALVCAALGDGRQSVIVRKGGIAEGRAGFQFRHREFSLFPTFFHEQLKRTRLTNAELPAQLPNEIEIRFFARIEETRSVQDWKTAQALAPLHILQESVVRERFDYDKAPGVQVALVRVFRLEPVWRFPDSKRYGGCRSWVELPAAPRELQLIPVLDEAEQAQRRKQFQRAISGQA
jgi:hypothetical protein